LTDLTGLLSVNFKQVKYYNF